MYARSEVKSNPAAPLGYLAPLCVAVFFIFIWAIVGARHRYIRQNQSDNPLDPESLVASRGFVGVISRSEVEKQFPLVNYSAWWTGRHQHDADLKEIGKRDSTVSDCSKDDDAIGHRGANTPGDHPTSPPETEGHDQSGTAPEHPDAHEDGREAVSPDPEDSHSLCAICMDGFEEGDMIRPLTCGHIFHPSCVDPWLTKRQACCPLCKKTFSRNRDSSSETRRAPISFTAILPAPPGAVLLRNAIIPRGP
ncbi:hypothetical protein HFD88_000513 [Aspergillus terreus]|nr:hypothetical protein HFD88_000513 [Aspergillus terreus]